MLATWRTTLCWRLPGASTDAGGRAPRSRADASSSGRARRVARIAGQRFRSSAEAQPASSISTPPGWLPPTSVTSTSRPPSPAAASWTARSSCAGSVASAVMARACGAPASRHRRARSSTAARVRATSATDARSRARATAAAPPSPRPAPRRSARRPASSRSITSSLARREQTCLAKRESPRRSLPAGLRELLRRVLLATSPSRGGRRRRTPSPPSDARPPSPRWSASGRRRWTRSAGRSARPWWGRSRPPPGDLRTRRWPR